jgi:hypothetical protein
MLHASKTPQQYDYYTDVINGTVKQTVDKVIKYVDDKYQLTNYMDGTNGVYRWNYDERGKNWGYNPFELSVSPTNSILGYLSNDDSLMKVYQHILDWGRSKYRWMSPKSKRELLVRLTLKSSQNDGALTCVSLDQYEGCEEKYIFNTKIKPDLEKPFAGKGADQYASYYYVVGQHQAVLQYAFKYNITEWKKEYYKYFARFANEVVDRYDMDATDDEKNKIWLNYSAYYRNHFVLWLSMFLELSGEYDHGDYSHYSNFNANTEEKLRRFIEEYIVHNFK